MTLCWVAGLSGTGKSTIVQQLLASNELAWDADDLSFWRDRGTGEAATVPAGGRPDGWTARYGWVIDPAKVPSGPLLLNPLAPASMRSRVATQFALPPIAASAGRSTASSR